MTQAGWLPEQPATDATLDDAPRDAFVPVTGATAPQRASVAPPPDFMLGSWRVDPARARVWVIGAHGGAGESVLAGLVDGIDTHHRWPEGPTTAAPPLVLMCARTDARGLAAAQAAARAWAAGATPPVRMLGLVLIADQPKKLPRELSARADLIAGGLPHVWRLPWVEDYRTGTPATVPREFRKQLHELETVINSEIGVTR